MHHSFTDSNTSIYGIPEYNPYLYFMTNRSEQLKSIRPIIDIDNSKSTDLELFQSQSLRPILKLQNELILSLMNHHLAEHKVVVKNLTDHKKTERIHDLVKSNLPLKQLLLGIVIAHFTNEELAFYYDNKKEVVKRIITMVLERICSQISELIF
ncbi:MAG: glyoxalase family protein [Bacteroidota bacterium]|nr:glyoxalase family protein [Bacteroidota bacterium]